VRSDIRRFWVRAPGGPIQLFARMMESDGQCVHDFRCSCTGQSGIRRLVTCIDAFYVPEQAHMYNLCIRGRVCIFIFCVLDLGKLNKLKLNLQGLVISHVFMH
jgi:hypothetical protein